VRSEIRHSKVGHQSSRTEPRSRGLYDKRMQVRKVLPVPTAC
jgi:hypothetical protein